MTVLETLKKKLPKSKESSLKVYARSLKRLYNQIDRKDNEVPESHSWLSDKDLKKAFEKIDVNIRRHLSSAAHIFLKAIGKPSDYWLEKMFSDQTKYKDHRKQNNKSATEQRLWITDGLKKLKLASTEYKRRIRNKLKKEPAIDNLWLYTQYLILRFYSEIQLRNDLANIQLKPEKKNNYLQKVKGGKYKLVMRTFKASDVIGERVIEISKALSRVLTEYIKFRSKVDLKHDYLLANSRGGVLSKAALGKTLRKLTKDLLDKGIGTRILRVFKASLNSKLLEKADKISNDLLHSAKQTREYVRK